MKLQLCADPNVKIVGGTNWDSPPRDLFIYNDFGLAGNEMFTSLGALFTYLRSIVHILLACMLESIQDLNFRLGIQTFSTENLLYLSNFSPSKSTSPGPNLKYVPYTSHYNPLLIRYRSWILTIHNTKVGKKYTILWL